MIQENRTRLLGVMLGRGEMPQFFGEGGAML